MNHVELYELQEDGNYNLYSVQYDYLKDKTVVSDKQTPIAKELIGKGIRPVQ